MAKTEQELRVIAESLGGFKKLKRIAGMLSHLHSSGCDRDKAGNRQLHFDDYVLLVLLYLFNPMIDSMRTLLKVAALPEVQKRLGVKRFSLGSFSESCRVFEPEKLMAVVEQLYGQSTAVGRQALPADRQQMLTGLPGLVELVDGTLLETFASVTEAMWISGGGGTRPGERPRGGAKHAWKLHLGFEVDRHVPVAWEITDARGTGDSDEKTVLHKRLIAGRTYVMDRGYAKFGLFNAIHAKASNYVCRVRDNSAHSVVVSRALDEKDLAAGVISDQTVSYSPSNGVILDHPARLVCVKITPHAKRGRTGGGTAGPRSDGILRILTDLTDVPAHVIAFLYEYRWTLEVFIRFFKQVLGCRHLLSTKQEGVQIQVCAAVICCMMLNALTGRKPTKWLVTLMSLHLQGLAGDDDVLKELNRTDNTGIKTRAIAEMWKKMGVK